MKTELEVEWKLTSRYNIRRKLPDNRELNL
jgi:hypothetical protein